MKKIKNDQQIEQFSTFIQSKMDIDSTRLNELVEQFTRQNYFNQIQLEFKEWETELASSEEAILKFIKEYSGKATPEDLSYSSEFGNLDDLISESNYLRCSNLDTAIYFAIKYPELETLPLIYYSIWPEGGVDYWNIELKTKKELEENYKPSRFESFAEECDVYAGRINFDNYNCHLTTKG